MLEPIVLTPQGGVPLEIAQDGEYIAVALLNADGTHTVMFGLRLEVLA